MKILVPTFLLIILTSLTHTALAAEQASHGMMQGCGMMGGGSMLAGMALMVLLFIALILAILSLGKYLFFNNSREGDRS